jgi:hypothetical protein
MPRKLLAVALAATFSLPAFAVQRTFISTSGSDANPCSTTQPCRSIAVALAATDPGGEIIVLGSGGYGSATIDKSVTIQSPSGTYAGISVFPGNDGITVNGANVSVVLRGLSINGQGGGKGVSFVQGNALFVEDCTIANMNSAGIAVTAASDVLIRDTTLRGNGGDGVQISASASVTISRLRAERNVLAGVSLSNGAQVSVRDSTLAENGQHGVFASGATGVSTKVTLENSTLSGNAGSGLVMEAVSASTKVEGFATRTTMARNVNFGSYVSSGGGGTASLTASDNMITANGIGMRADGAQSTLTASVNTVAGNTSFGLSSVNGATIYTNQNNRVRDNNGAGAQVEGTPTLFPGI